MPNWCDCVIAILIDDPHREQILADFKRGIRKSKDPDDHENGSPFTFVINFDRVLFLADFDRFIKQTEDEVGGSAFLINFDPATTTPATKITTIGTTIRPELQALLVGDWTRSGWVNSQPRCEPGSESVVCPPYEWEDEDNNGLKQINVFNGFTKWSPPTEFLAAYSSCYPDTVFTLCCTIEHESHYHFSFHDGNQNLVKQWVENTQTGEIYTTEEEDEEEETNG